VPSPKKNEDGKMFKANANFHSIYSNFSRLPTDKAFFFFFRILLSFWLAKIESRMAQGAESAAAAGQNKNI